MQNYLQKAINLAKKTGDRLIIFDTNEPENSFVLMPINEYEKIIIGKSEVRGLTEDELLDKINRDIAIWKTDNEFQQNTLNNKNFLNKNSATVRRDFEYFEDETEDEDSEDDDLYYYENNERDDEDVNDLMNEKIKEKEESQFKHRGNLWRIPKDIEASAEEII